MSNRLRKESLFNQNPNCHWCGRLTVLTNIAEIKGTPNPLMATIDHVISRFNPERWVKRKPGQVRKVLACFECNNRRSTEEQALKTTEEIKNRSEGFSLNPRGKPHIINTFQTVEEVLDTLKNKGIVVNSESCTTNT